MNKKYYREDILQENMYYWRMCLTVGRVIEAHVLLEYMYYWIKNILLQDNSFWRHFLLEDFSRIIHSYIYLLISLCNLLIVDHIKC